MAGIALLLPTEDMVQTAKSCVQKEGLDVKEIRHIITSNAVSQARSVVAGGASVIVARGYQALVIKKYTNVPVIEMTLTGQEIGLMVKKAKQMLPVLKPVIGLVGFQSMFSNVDYFDELFDVTMRTYLIGTAEELPKAAQRAVNDRVDIVIGGNIAIMAAQEAGIAHLFLESTADSIREAVKSAQSVIYATQVEQRYTAQIGAFLDNAANGLLRISATGIVTSVNHIMEEVVGKKREEMIGKRLTDVMPEMDGTEAEEVLAGKKEMYSSFIHVGKQAVVFVLTAVKVEGMIDSAILFCYTAKKQESMEADRMRKMYLNGYVAQTRFPGLKSQDKKMKECIELAKLYSLSREPVLILAETGCEAEEMAEAIHNNSIRKNGPFIHVNCAGMTEEQQEIALFGEAARNRRDTERVGAVVNADQGTLLVEEMDKMAPRLQYKLFCAIQHHAVVSGGSDRAGAVDVRVIAVAEEELYRKMERGEFRNDLFYTVSSLCLRIPPLRERPADLEALFCQAFQEALNRYNRYHILSDSARELIRQYGWHGNRIQLMRFVDRMVLSAQKRTIEGGYVHRLLTELYPATVQADEKECLVLYRDARAEELTRVLEKHHGNRERAAKELGISKTTLWRRMKKYGL